MGAQRSAGSAAAAFAADVPIVALHLTRPPVDQDRILKAMERFAADRPQRLRRLRERLDDA